ncbi:MAG TPA: hypothetical protein ENO27_01375 [Caldithrix sp.]|nr:hypothetical protein [Caldithrix sp.]
MKIAIHQSEGSFSDDWINCCKEKHIPYKIVNCYSTNIVKQIKDCDALMWHFHHASSKDVLFAKQLLFAVQATGKKVFPDFNTAWHFDDKVGQKYLLEAIKGPLVPSYAFCTKGEAIRWAKSTVFPKVFKLRRGAGSANVRLVKTRKQAIKLINKSFGKGFRLYNPWEGLKERRRKYKMGETTFVDILQGIVRLLIRTNFERTVGKEKGYVYFQDFVAGCSCDYRVKVINGKCWAFKRLVRENDFRASGSGNLVFSECEIPLKIIEIAFEISERLKLQCIAFDFLIDKEETPFITEMSYGFGYSDGENYGYWTRDLLFHKGSFNPFCWMIDSLINSR